MSKYLKENLLQSIDEFLEKQDILDKLTENRKLNEYGYSEIHTIREIENMEYPNVTKIADKLNMTRGAISKITKKLIGKQIIESYKLPNNTLKIFFKFTDYGKQLYNEHEKRHALWTSRDIAFYNGFDEQQLLVILDFMEKYNRYLKTRIEDLSVF